MGINLGVLKKRDTTLITLDFDLVYTDSSRFAHVFTSQGTAPTVSGGLATFNATGLIKTPDALSFDAPLCTGDFTLEARLRLTELGRFHEFLSKGSILTAITTVSFFVDAANALRFRARKPSGSGSVELTSADNAAYITDTNFHHVAVTRELDTFRLFIDGFLVDNYTEVNFGNLYDNNEPLEVGAPSLDIASFGLKGQIDWLKISSSALYTANFTPPV